MPRGVGGGYWLIVCALSVGACGDDVGAGGGGGGAGRDAAEAVRGGDTDAATGE